uniref:Carboxylesterase type B domain-containing protein n=1 Tax=Heliothis virescens TaxID=7102 RepID=A0A2A4JYV0_HELVI
MKKTFLCVLLFVANVFSESRVDPLVLISGQGLVRGTKATDGDYSMFLGIPYAQVDAEDPFGPSHARQPFQELIYNAKNGSIKCPQMGSSSSDTEVIDCLSLNIYVPFRAGVNDPLPVLVWFHGGDFVRGSAGEYGAKNLVKHDIVVITVNYRLGPYGFMCLDTPTVPGNQGLKDQYTALTWIRSNIGSFGGNPYNVTIAGQDAGAVSVLLHLYADNDKLFHKVIVESGTPQTEGMFVNADVNTAIVLAEHLGFNTTSTDEALNFLAHSPHNLVTAAAYELDLQLRPCKEKSFSGVENFVEYDPYSLTNEKKVKNTPVLIGLTSQERDSLSSDYYDSDPFYEKLKNNFDLHGDQLEKAATFVRRFYLGDKSVSEEVATELENFESDFVYNHPSERIITRLFEENVGSRMYEYLFSYVGDSSKEGAGHSAELKYLFNLANDDSEISEDDQLIIDRITTLWANFVKYGNPTPRKTDLIPEKWTATTASTRPTMVIDTDIRMESRIENQRMAFWDLFYSMYGSYSKLVRECVFTDCC